MDKLANTQVVINCIYSVAPMCTREDALTYILGMLSIDDVMSYNSLTTDINTMSRPIKVNSNTIELLVIAS